MKSGKILLLFAVAAIFFCSCKKMDVPHPNQKKSEELNQQQRFADGTGCNTGLRNYMQSRMSGEDFTLLEFDSAYLYPVEGGRMNVYKIPFRGVDAETDFVLIAADPIETSFKGHIIQIQNSNDWMNEGVFSGRVRFQSLGRDTTQTMEIVNGQRSSLLPLQPSLLEPYLVGAPMDEIVIGTVRHITGGYSYSMWMNLLSWLGITPGGGSSGPGGGLSGTGGGVFGPISGGGGGSTGGSSGGGQSSDPCNPNTGPVIVIGNGSYDPSQPFANITNPTNGNDVAPINNGVGIQTIAPPQQQNLRMIGGSRRSDHDHTNPLGDEDMMYGSPSIPGQNYTGILPYCEQATDDLLFYMMDDLFYYCTFWDNGLANVGRSMIQKFKDKTGGTFSDPVLTDRVKNSTVFQNYLKKFGKKLDEELAQTNFDISLISFVDMGIERPTFNGFYNKWHGLQILINDTESTDFMLSNFQYYGNGKWTVTVKVRMTDHFGLDKHDALLFQNSHPGFATWWTLQHRKGYVPFETQVEAWYQISVGF